MHLREGFRGLLRYGGLIVGDHGLLHVELFHVDDSRLLSLKLLLVLLLKGDRLGRFTVFESVTSNDFDHELPIVQVGDLFLDFLFESQFRLLLLIAKVILQRRRFGGRRLFSGVRFLHLRCCFYQRQRLLRVFEDGAIFGRTNLRQVVFQLFTLPVEIVARLGSLAQQRMLREGTRHARALEQPFHVFGRESGRIEVRFFQT